MRLYWVLPALCLSSFAVRAQPPQRIGYVQAVGNASVSATPDKALIQLSVVTTAVSATDASNQNATQVNAVLAALAGVLGPNANIKTLSYSLTPNYNFPQNGPQVLTGYTAQNTVQVTLTDLSLIGKVIDTGIQSGANRVQGLTFGLQNDQPVRTQALKAATVQAKANADAMAAGLGLTTGSIILIQEGATVTPSPVLLAAASAAPSTPIETGVVNIQASVTIQVSISQ
jgi:uncharacterized protein YggE